MSKQTVTINGVIYDVLTGMPIKKAPTAATHFTTNDSQHSQHVHHTTQKSTTLHRATVKKAAPTKAHQVARPVVQKSPSITRFAPHPAGIKSAAKPSRHMDIGPVAHPLAVTAHNKIQAAKQTATAAVAPKPAVKPSHIIKKEVIAEALDKAPRHNAKVKRVKQPRNHSRHLSIASASLALIMLAGYFTYLNMPNLSVRVAAAQAGFDATYPGYRPDGYRVNKVAYTDGQVGIQYLANGSSQGFTVKQEKSSWDSSALLANYVEPASHGGYIPHSEHGITIYVFNNNAAWVNDGIRYTIEGNAPLSSEQILDLATSM
ncbi:MAG TPA: DUF4367 domain-containing protein [Candidatus Saccharimonadales bacterium]